jgi:hypothetical protein
LTTTLLRLKSITKGKSEILICFGIPKYTWINPLVKGEVILRFRKCFELSDNENITYQDVWDAAKAEHRYKCIALHKHTRKAERLKFYGGVRKRRAKHTQSK